MRSFDSIIPSRFRVSRCPLFIMMLIWRFQTMWPASQRRLLNLNDRRKTKEKNKGSDTIVFSTNFALFLSDSFILSFIYRISSNSQWYNFSGSAQFCLLPVFEPFQTLIPAEPLLLHIWGHCCLSVCLFQTDLLQLCYLLFHMGIFVAD